MGSKPEGQSPGVMDMVGNVSEWVTVSAAIMLKPLKQDRAVSAWNGVGRGAVFTRQENCVRAIVGVDHRLFEVQPLVFDVQSLVWAGPRLLSKLQIYQLKAKCPHHNPKRQ